MPEQERRMSRDQPLRRGLLPALAVAAVLLGTAAMLVVRAVGGGAPALVGTDLGARPAPDFALTDHRGRTVRLSDFRGKAVALTFIYTNCPDVCPLTTENLRTAYELLPAATRDDVRLVAVTLDPARDTPQALREYSAVHRLADNPHWFALRGDPPTLERVWRDYGVYPGTDHAAHGSYGTPAVGGGEGHTDALYLIDPAGRERVFMRSAATPQEIAANLAALLD